MSSSKTILVSPLDWGLGHATRLIPIIDYFLEKNNKVILGGNGKSLVYLRNYYPELEFCQIPSAKIKYGKKSAIGLSFSPSLFRFVRGIHREHFALKRIVRKHKIDIVVSDNRLGLYCKHIKSIYLTHQLNVFTGLYSEFSDRIVNRFHKHFLSKFDYCFVPDYSMSKSLAGDLIKYHNQSELVFLGPLSRFYKKNTYEENSKHNDILVMLSGPEPQRSIFEEIVTSKFFNIDRKVVIVRGVVSNDAEQPKEARNIKYIDNPNDNQLYELIRKSEIIICRSGYSTLMDLAFCQRKAILVPTPGQPEQEYLADYFQEKYSFKYCNQASFMELNIGRLEKDEKWDYKCDMELTKKTLDLYL